MSKKLVALAAVLACAGAAWADPINAVATDPADPGSFAIKSSPGTAILGAFNAPGLFVDVFWFSLDALQEFSISLTNSPVGNQGRINFFAAVLVPPGSPAGDLTLVTSGPTSQTLFGSWTPLAAGVYGLYVGGESLGTVGATYGGSATAVPIPEPSTYALMLAGIGAIGLLASRRRATAS
jgi:hypothetical protein